MTDIRDAKFYVCANGAAFAYDLFSLDFDPTLHRAKAVAGRASGVHFDAKRMPENMK